MSECRSQLNVTSRACVSCSPSTVAVIVTVAENAPGVTADLRPLSVSTVPAAATLLVGACAVSH